MTTLFISDLHLCAERPEKLALFKRLLQGPARDAESLYILGDLFEAWAGDDDSTQSRNSVSGSNNRNFGFRVNRRPADNVAHETLD